MTQEQAEALIAGQKIKYSDGRIATVTQAATVPPPLPAEFAMFQDRPAAITKVVSIVFDAEPDPKATCQIKSNDFVNAEPLA